MTTATHGLDSAPRATTVAELLARNGRPSGRTTPGRRARSSAETPDRFLPVPAPADRLSSAPDSTAGKFDGSLAGLTPAVFEPTPRLPADDEAPTVQYRYDKAALTALLASETAAAPDERKPRNGRKIAGIAFAGAVLFGGFGLLATTQSPDDHDASASGIGQADNNTPQASVPSPAAPAGADVVGLGAAPTGTTAVPAPPPPPQPIGSPNPAPVSSGSSAGKAKAVSDVAPRHAAPPAKPAPPRAAAAPPQAAMPQLPPGTYVWPFNPNSHGMHHGGPGGPGGGGGKHRRH